MSELKTEGGIPILGDDPQKYEAVIPIDPAHMPELRDMMAQSVAISQRTVPVALQLIDMMTRAVEIGQANEAQGRLVRDFLEKLLRLHGVDQNSLIGVPLSEWLNLEKGQIRVPKK